MPEPLAPARILIVDDEESVCEVLAFVLKRDGHEIETLTDPRACLRSYRERRFDIVLQDIRMPGMDGITLLRELKAADPDATVLVMTAYSTWQAAVEAMRLGAFDFIRKPFDNRDVRASVSRALLARRTRAASRTEDAAPPGAIIGSSAAIKQVFDLIRRVAPTDTTILIQGESGTGKEQVARALHHGSPRAGMPFLPFNCAAFTETLIESELFGHVRGSFTGATGDKKGLFEVADGGSLFLDEVGEMSLAMQVKLLRVLEDRACKPVGGTKDIPVDVRFLAATNRDLETEVKTGRFREDLYYRLNVISLVLPTLRERKDDIPLLAGHFLKKYAEKLRKEIVGFSTPAMEAMLQYDWPGNIRELENAIQRAIALHEPREGADPRIAHELQVEALVAKIRDGGPIAPPVHIPAEGVNLEKSLEDMERAYIERALQMSGWQLTAAARLLGMTFRSMRYRVKKLEIDRNQMVKDDEAADGP